MIQVVGRYFFRSTPGWTEEVARQLMILFSFIGIAIGVRDKIHIALSFFVETVMGRKAKLIVETWGKILIFVMGIMMSMQMGPFFTILRYNRLPGTGMPVGYTYVMPTAVGILLSLIAIYQIYDHIKYGLDEEQKQLENTAKQESEK
jgi:TRAP-type C4-dicarboxylate transport system permease small subunit